MTQGRKVCNVLRDIRQQIADTNDIEYVTTECPVEEECSGTCPKCESEVKYLENELHKRKILGKAVAVAGISLGIATIAPACNEPAMVGGIEPYFEDTLPPPMVGKIIENGNTMPIVPFEHSSSTIDFVPPDITEISTE